MSPPEPATAGAERRAVGYRARYGRYVGLLAVVMLVLIAVNTLARQTERALTGIAPGQRLPPFAVPLALGDAQRATPTSPPTPTRARPGACRRAPCAGAQILNICQLYEQGPLVLALFVDAGSCPEVLSEMQALAPVLPRRALRGGGDQGRTRPRCAGWCARAG